jgi:xanthosine utilization system XapX-like protein
MNVRSPAPPLVALVGLLGMLAGKQVIPVGKRLLSGSAFSVAWREAKCAAHIFGMLPGHYADEAARISATDTRRITHDQCSRSHCEQCSCDHARPQLIVG